MEMVPEMSPVDESMDRPAGNPEALYVKVPAAASVADIARETTAPSTLL